ncbi:MAG TPA: hypothetical protein VGI58_18120 [Streptosporangiaceae bacterium]
MMWQPGPAGDRPDSPQPPRDPGSPTAPFDPVDFGGPAGQLAQPGAAPRRRRRGSVALFALIGVLGLAGLGVCAVGVAHRVLPRHFTAAQQRAITNWELEGRWRGLTAGAIFPATISYQVPGQAFNATSGLPLRARRLGIAPQAACADGVSPPAALVLRQHGCLAVLRATYLDSTGSMVATTAVAVLPDPAAAEIVLGDLTGSSGLTGTPSAPYESRLLARPLRVAGTPAAGFRAPQHQLANATVAGPYVILTTTGFADGRPHVTLDNDHYVDQEMTSFEDALASSAGATLGHKPPVPSCPGAPGC